MVYGTPNVHAKDDDISHHVMRGFSHMFEYYEYVGHGIFWYMQLFLSTFFSKKYNEDCTVM